MIGTVTGKGGAAAEVPKNDLPIYPVDFASFTSTRGKIVRNTRNNVKVKHQETV